MSVFTLPPAIISRDGNVYALVEYTYGVYTGLRLNTAEMLDTMHSPGFDYVVFLRNPGGECFPMIDWTTLDRAHRWLTKNNLSPYAIYMRIL